MFIEIKQFIERISINYIMQIEVVVIITSVD